MFGFFAPRHGRRPRRTTLALECLDRRDLLSTSSAAIHAVTAPQGHPTVQLAFFLGQQDGLLHDVFGPLNAGSTDPKNIQAFTAGHDAQGNADVFAEAGDGSLWEDDGHWTNILGPGKVASFAAVDGGRLYAAFTDGTLHEYGPVGWSQIGSPVAVATVDAVTNKGPNGGHNDTIYVLNQDHTFGEFTQPNLRQSVAGQAGTVGSPFVYEQLAGTYTVTIPGLVGLGHIILPPITITRPDVTQFSAGTDESGNADVYVVWADGSLRQNFQGSTAWTTVSGPIAGGFMQISATDSGLVWMLTADHHLARYDDANGLVTYGDLGTFTQISAVGTNESNDTPTSTINLRDVYAASTDGQLCEYTEQDILQPDGTYGVIPTLTTTQDYVKL